MMRREEGCHIILVHINENNNILALPVLQYDDEYIALCNCHLVIVAL